MCDTYELYSLESLADTFMYDAFKGPSAHWTQAFFPFIILSRVFLLVPGPCKDTVKVEAVEARGEQERFIFSLNHA